jgi:hypothetical protein
MLEFAAMLLKRLFTLSILLALSAFAYLTFFSYDCGEPLTKVENGSTDNWFMKVTTTSTPHKDWKGHCYLTVRTETLFYFDHGAALDTSKTTVTTSVFRMKPGPMTLIESR